MIVWRIREKITRTNGGGKAGGRGRAAARAALCRGAAYEGRQLEILAFALQYVSVILFLIYSVHRGWVLPVGGAAPWTFAQGW